MYTWSGRRIPRTHAPLSASKPLWARQRSYTGMRKAKMARTAEALNQEIENAITQFNTHMDCIPAMFGPYYAYFAFMGVLTGTDMLAGYRFPDNDSAGFPPGRRRAGNCFEKFIGDYCPAKYHQHASRLWQLRCGLVHSFTPRQWTLVSGRPDLHLKPSPIGDYYLNAEDLYADFRAVANCYFEQLRTTDDLKRLIERRLDDLEKGGGIYTGVLP